MFLPQKVIGRDDYCAFYLIGQLVGGILELGWIRESEIDAAKAEFHSFVRQQRQVVESAGRSRAPNISVLAFCNQPGFRCGHNLYEVIIGEILNHLNRL